MTIQREKFFKYFKTKYAFVVILLAGLATFLTGCYSHYFPDTITPVGNLQGIVRDERYHSKSDLFSVDIPLSARRGCIEDFFNKDELSKEMYGWVAFANNCGYYLKYEVIDPKLPVLIEIAHYPDSKQDILEHLFSNWIVPNIKDIAIDAEIFSQEQIILDNGEPALFAHFGLSQDSQNLDNFYFKGKVPGSACLRGCLLTFSKNNYLVLCDLRDMTSYHSDYKKCVNFEFSKTWILRNLLESINSFSCKVQIENRDYEADVNPVLNGPVLE